MKRALQVGKGSKKLRITKKEGEKGEEKGGRKERNKKKEGTYRRKKARINNLFFHAQARDYFKL